MWTDGEFYTEPAEYFWNPYLDMWCVIGTTFCSPDLSVLKAMWKSPDMLIRVDKPDSVVDENSEW